MPTPRRNQRLEDSCFYRLSNKRKLAEVLEVALSELDTLTKNDRCYEVFPKKERGKSSRLIEAPRPRLQSVQHRIAVLLSRIEPPSYLHSAFRGRSYVTNARAHPHGVPIAKIDVRKFFPSVSYYAVRNCFLYRFECSSDVAEILAKLTTRDGHLPTGGSSSTIVSFFAYERMFNEIAALAHRRGATMTVCVDDITFSGKAVSEKLLFEVRAIVRRYGLRVHKRHMFGAASAKIVTGVALTGNGLRLPNVRRKKLHESFLALFRCIDPHDFDLKAKQLIGRAAEAAQIEPSFAQQLRFACLLARRKRLELKFD